MDFFDYSETLLSTLHFMITKYQPSKWPGRYRSGDIFVTSADPLEPAYTGPEADLVPPLMNELIEWLHDGDVDTPAYARAAMAHLNLVGIHLAGRQRSHRTRTAYLGTGPHRRTGSRILLHRGMAGRTHQHSPVLRGTPVHAEGKLPTRARCPLMVEVRVRRASSSGAAGETAVRVDCAPVERPGWPGRGPRAARPCGLSSLCGCSRRSPAYHLSAGREPQPRPGHPRHPGADARWTADTTRQRNDPGLRTRGAATEIAQAASAAVRGPGRDPYASA